MPDQTPLQKLDDAVHAFLTETGALNGGRWVTGWTLGASTSRIANDGDGSLPLVTGAQYALGPQTSTTDAAGIVRFLDVVLERATWDMLDSDEDDDDE